MRPRFADVPATVDKRTVADLAEWPYPKRSLVPLTEVVHDRLSVEVFRGCTRGCRFCQAGMITRPVRERPAEQVRTMIREGLRRTGYDEVSLTSLSTADFSDIEPVVKGAARATAAALPGSCGTTTINLPSLRVDAFTVGLAGEVSNGRRSGLTFAPEAGSWRLRQVINKLITEEDLYGAVESAFSQGWTRMKLYFLTGLPTETDDDTLGIAELAKQLRRDRQAATRSGRRSRSASAASCPSRTHRSSGSARTPRPSCAARSTWCARRCTRRRGVNAQVARPARPPWPRASPAAATAASGASIERVWRAGGTFQEWGEFFDLDRWTDAMDGRGAVARLVRAPPPWRATRSSRGST